MRSQWTFDELSQKPFFPRTPMRLSQRTRREIIVFWNPGAERIFGYASTDAIGRSLDIIIPARLQKRHWDGYHRVMKSGESRYGHGDILAVPGIKKDGNQISIEFTITPMRDETDQLVGLIAILRDVTKRFEEIRALKRKLGQAAKELQ